uniref:Uncharacterized protein n=1 Tax=viral metagenome TaxID=1070528 RepID=A0A6C0KHS3_9ZZZZ
MSMVSKSFFYNSVQVNKMRPLYNPVFSSQAIAAGSEGSGDLSFITADDLVSFKEIEQKYGYRIEHKLYEQIPNDYDKYIKLYVMVNKVKAKIKNDKLLTLVQIAQEALVGAINSYALYGSNVSLTLDKVGLNKTINDILTGKNEKFIEMAQASGQLTITKSFKLAPVFNYYIIIYGMPAFGVGFDPVKINFLVDVLKSKGINPYK